MSSSDTLIELQERVEQFSPQQKRLLKERLLQLGVAMPSRGGRLIGFYQTGSSLDEEELRALCTSRLPAHMVPQRFIQQDELALTANGKLDRNAMRVRLWSASNQVVSDHDMTVARNEVEATLIDIWSDVLGIDEISVFDNFFEMGGDSLQIIRILSRASKAGLTIKPDAIFAHPTIAELAQLAGAGTSEESGKAEVAAHGAVPLMPIQNWFFDVVRTNRHHWNQSYLFKLQHPVSSDAVTAACGQLMSMHPGLRAQFSQQNGIWTSFIAESMQASVREHITSSSSNAEQTVEMKAVSDEENANMNLGDGPLFKVIHFSDSGGVSYLNLIAHHLVVDAVSWQILISDLQQLLQDNSPGLTNDSAGQVRPSAGESSLIKSSPIKPSPIKPSPIKPSPIKPSPIKQWAEELASLAKSTTLQSSEVYWHEQAGLACVDLPAGGSVGATNPEGVCKWVTRSLDETLTEKLRTETPKELRASIQELILSALVRVLTGWAKRSDITLDLEGHGREALVDGVDISQTVGWCTTVFPVNFIAETAVWASPVDSLRRVKDQLRAVPENGLSHGLFKYGSSSRVKQALNEAVRSNVLFNYLGVEAKGENTDPLFALIDGRFGVTRHTDTERAYKLELNAVIRDNCLTIDWAFGPGLYAQELIEQLANDLMINITDLIEGTDSVNAAVSPTDFPMAGLDQASLDNLSSQLDGLDDE